MSTTPTGPTHGVAYIALGDIRFKEEALASARTLKRHSPALRIVLYTDTASPNLDREFDGVALVQDSFGTNRVGARPWKAPGWLTRIEIFASFPFDRTLFLDTDTEIVGDVGDLLQILEKHDIAAAHAPYRFSGKIKDIPSSFPEFNCGVVSIRKSRRAAAFLARWRELYLGEPEFWHIDQHSFRKAVWQSDVRLAVLPPEFNLRPLSYLGRNSPKILHGYRRSRETNSLATKRSIRFLSVEHGCGHHRSGWEFALTALRSLTHPNGVSLDTMIENTYVWHLANYASFLPMREPWVGIAHVPQSIPAGYFDRVRPQNFVTTGKFRDSLPVCQGLFALSSYHADWLRGLGPPVEVLYHPVDFHVRPFSFEAFRASRTLLHVGWWLRRFETFNRLSAPGYTKCLLQLRTENAKECVRNVSWSDDVRFIDYLPNHEYDALLARSIVFVDLIDCSANNLVIDCIARATPLIINRHPAAEEYLGKNYPLFYEGIEQAQELLRNDEVILEGSLYMTSNAVRNKLSATSFRESLARSKIYQSLPSC